MPELPEVEVTVRGIGPALQNRTITDVWLDWPRSLVEPIPEVFCARLPGQVVRTVTRRGKYVVIQLDADCLVIHLKMSGRLYVVPNEATDYADQWVHFRFQLENAHQLRFSDARKFGRVYLVSDLNTITGHLGPEPLDNDFTLDVFQKRLVGRSGKIKPLLLNQEFVAGLGNIYADEALHYAHVLPTRAADSLTEKEVERLWQGIQVALRSGLAREGASINWYRKPDGTKGNAQNGLLAYGREGKPCQTCHEGVIQRKLIGQRSSYYCPNCQY